MREMKKIIVLIVFLFVLATVYSQTPDFSLVGFGSAATGGGNGAVVAVNNLTDLKAALLRTDAITIKISGTIAGENGGVLLEVKSNKTILGVGSTAFLSMIQLYLKNAQNVIIRNIRFSMIGSTLESDADCISIATTSSGECKDIWIDHCEFYNVTPVLPENAASKDKYDGLIDIKKTSHNITISWNYFHDHWKCSLIGYTDDDDYDRRITYHHNYFKNIKSRVPSYRHGTGHIFNNYYESLPNDPTVYPSCEGINTRMDACLKVEGNYFKNYNRTIYFAVGDSPTEGFAYGTGNIFDNSPAQTANTCNSFIPPYNYFIDKAEDIPAMVSQWSGIGKLGLNSTASSRTNQSDLSDQFIVFQNSKTNQLEVNFFSSTNCTALFTILDINGKRIIQKKIKAFSGVNSYKLNLSGPISEINICTLQIERKIFVQKIMRIGS